jgi:hypothetical protein
MVHDRALLNLQYRPWYRQPPRQNLRIYAYANRNTDEVLALRSKKCNLCTTVVGQYVFVLEQNIQASKNRFLKMTTTS